jgi:hypothetical protein
MIEGRQHPRFTLEALQPVGIVRERPRQNLDGDIASKLGVTGAVELRPCRQRRAWRESRTDRLVYRQPKTYAVVRSQILPKPGEEHETQLNSVTSVTANQQMARHISKGPRPVRLRRFQ